MAEWSIAAVLKTVVRATGPGVRIPLSPQTISLLFRPRRNRFFVFRQNEPGSPERVMQENKKNSHTLKRMRE